jgi:hypothetical protein
MNQPTIARRHLRFTAPDSATQRECTIGITAPHEESHEDAAQAQRHDPMAVCEIVFEGLPVPPIVVHGADSLQALAIAADIDPILRGLEREHGFEFFSGRRQRLLPAETMNRGDKRTSPH